MRRIWLLLAVAAGYGCGASVRAQSAGSMSSGSIRASSSVVVTTIAHKEADGTSTLDVAVFWRGAPGWFTAADPGGLSAGGTSTGLPDGRPGPVTDFIGVGGLRLEVQFDPATGRVRIQDQSISSQSGNVILVDEVSVSQAEYTTMAFRTAPGAKVVGSTTAGAFSASQVMDPIVPGTNRIRCEYRGRIFESRFLPKAHLTFIVADALALKTKNEKKHK